MRFEDFIEEGSVHKATPDPQKAKALVNMASNNLRVVKQISLDDDSASLILSSAYESLRQVLEAMAHTQGYKVFSHLAYTSYLSEKGEEGASATFDRLRKLRNGVNYYGKSVPKEVTKQALQDIELLCNKLQKKYL